ncbi:hypothetical protein FPQ18DRAFT_310605 [Pyronema domesticum]|nr:hypothetical protein FPQ18DRAFT_310605 [Pyronema domesticum]
MQLSSIVTLLSTASLCLAISTGSAADPLQIWKPVDLTLEDTTPSSLANSISALLCRKWDFKMCSHTFNDPDVCYGLVGSEIDTKIRSVVVDGGCCSFYLDNFCSGWGWVMNTKNGKFQQPL